MNLKGFFQRAWPHILLLGLMVFFLLAGPMIYNKYFVKVGKPIDELTELPSETNAVHFSLDGLEEYNSQGVYALSGWAFPMVEENVPSGDYERILVLQSLTDKYIFRADTTKRIDIQTVFQNLEMDVIMSGLSALIFKDAVPSGTYQVGLLFKNINDSSLIYVDLNYCISRTPNRLYLIGLEAAGCREVSHNDGDPIHTNISLPIETTDAQFSFESLDPLDGKGVYRLSGWAFPMGDENVPTSDYEPQVVLWSDSSNYVFPANSYSRPDVDIYFDDLDMDLTKSGISALISQASLGNDTYHVGLIFTNTSDGKAYFFDTSRCVTQNADGLILEESGSKSCVSPQN